MEYEGAGSFWAQLTITQEDQVGTVVLRRIDELLRDSSASIYDIIADDEAISEFRSGNDKIVNRLIASDGLDALISLVTNSGIPRHLAESQKSQIPFVASELIACENDALLDSLTRIVPGQRNGLDRLFDFLILADSLDPTTAGYVVKVLLVLINRRVTVVDKYVKDHHDAVQQGLLDHLSDRSVTDLVFRLCLDDGTKSFRLDYSSLFSRMNETNSINILWLIDSMFGKPLLGNNEQVITNFHFLKADLYTKDGLSVLLSKGFSEHNFYALEITSIVITYSFTRPAAAEPGLMDSGGWESFASTARSINKSSIDEDSCVFDDEMNSPKSVQPVLTPFTELGSLLVRESIAKLNTVHSDWISSIQHVHAFLRLMVRCIEFGETLSAQIITESVVKAFTKYPHSSAIHNLCRDCVLKSSSDIETIAADFVPFALNELETNSSGSMASHLTRILSHLDEKVPSLKEGRPEIYSQAIHRWNEIDTRLVDRQDRIPTRAPSPAGARPIIDLKVSDQWVVAESTSPQVRFEVGSDEDI
jgi:hypothetical protein